MTAEGYNLKNLDYRSISVGQHITAIGTYTLPSSGIITLNTVIPTTGSTAEVRLQSTQLYGQLLSAATGSVTMNLQKRSAMGPPAESVQFRGRRHLFGAGPDGERLSRGYDQCERRRSDADQAAGTSRSGSTASCPGSALTAGSLSFPEPQVPRSSSAGVSGVNEEAACSASCKPFGLAAGTTTPFASSEQHRVVDRCRHRARERGHCDWPRDHSARESRRAVVVAPNTVVNCVATPSPCAPVRVQHHHNRGDGHYAHRRIQ